MKASLLEFTKDKQKPIVDNCQNPIYTWDFFTWLRQEQQKKPIVREIAKRGLGYCGSCGQFSYFIKQVNPFSEMVWECQQCGYGNVEIHDFNWKR